MNLVVFVVVFVVVILCAFRVTSIGMPVYDAVVFVFVCAFHSCPVSRSFYFCLLWFEEF